MVNMIKHFLTDSTLRAFFRMSGVSHFLLSWYILGSISCCSWAWTVDIPNTIKAMLGSCVVIPCSFDYYENPPHNPNRVVWYQYVRHGYPLVYDNRNSQSVIDIFRGKTSKVIIFGGGKQCSLKIWPVTWHHHRQRIYPWVDPENVGKWTYRFFDKTVTIEVTDRAEKPDIVISGDMRVGQSVTVQCSVYHSCVTNPPSLHLNIPLKSHRLDTTLMSNGMSKTTLMTKLNIERELQIVKCSVHYKGGQTAISSIAFNAKCSFLSLNIRSPEEFLEGQPSKVTCTATFTCPKQAPVFKWSYGNMPAFTSISRIAETQWKSESTLTFTASANDNGRSLTCYMQFNDGTGRQEAMVPLRVKRNILSRGWYFTTPDSVTGMRGSCVFIPCRFTYTNSMPADLRVIWYLLQGNQYPPVYDERQDVISKYRGITSLTGSVGEQNCSLKINKLDEIHGQDRLYPWIDKNPITFYHMADHSFYDKTTQIIILDHAPDPQLSTSDTPRVEEETSVVCSVQHTCFSSPPLLTISGILGSDHTSDTSVSDGVWERRIERRWTPKEEDQSVKCTVRYQGGQTATSELRLNVRCPYEKITMTEHPIKATEGVAQSVICSVSYKCRKNKPTIVWNYSDMQRSVSDEQLPNNNFVARSNLTFIGSLDDNGKSLTCTAQFLTGNTSDSTIIHVKKYEKPIEVVKMEEVFHTLAGEVPFRFPALTQSCVVIPCSFQQQENMLLTKGVWTKKSGRNIYHNAQSQVLDHFKGRTKILGRMDEGNCSLEIDDINAFDNGPFCFHAEHKKEKYRFNSSCVFVVMKASPDKPAMTQIPTEVDAGTIVTVSCSVTHTCSSHPPEFSWSVSNLTSEATHTLLPQGVWKSTSTITFMADGGDGEKSLTCTASYWRGRKQATTGQLTVKGSLGFQLKRSLPVTIPVLILLLIVTVAAVVIFKRKKSQRPPPRPEKRRSLWERLSRRQPVNSGKPPRPEKRRSVWSRFSREENHHIAWEE
ncbi:uncharacterized protein LOC130532721 isoform X2 [Takifugu flavidus]|uniref:uncharacterized protein LOC130532721 isoform X2 n=1 Tax=Takifugu flavidus TaxID=433684 RepID=UPI0025447CB1|nr:uncharacterized protein LOC130532721 isoform X2 [Takifugu flavidus]